MYEHFKQQRKKYRWHQINKTESEIQNKAQGQTATHYSAVIFKNNYQLKFIHTLKVLNLDLLL